MAHEMAIEVFITEPLALNTHGCETLPEAPYKVYGETSLPVVSMLSDKKMASEVSFYMCLELSRTDFV